MAVRTREGVSRVTRSNGRPFQDTSGDWPANLFCSGLLIIDRQLPHSLIDFQQSCPLEDCIYRTLKTCRTCWPNPGMPLSPPALSGVAYLSSDRIVSGSVSFGENSAPLSPFDKIQRPLTDALKMSESTTSGVLHVFAMCAIVFLVLHFGRRDECK